MKTHKNPKLRDDRGMAAMNSKCHRGFDRDGGRCLPEQGIESTEGKDKTGCHSGDKLSSYPNGASGVRGTHLRRAS
jgi:hypothetical protein